MILSRLNLLILKFPGTAGRAERSTSFPAPMLDDETNRHLDLESSRLRRQQWKGQSFKRWLARRPQLSGQRVTEKHAGPNTSIWLCGNSLGCATVLHTRGQTHSRSKTHTGLILRNPPPFEACDQKSSQSPIHTAALSTR